MLAALLFDGGHRHVTAESLHAQADSMQFKVSLATIYNTLRCFRRAGLLREIGVDGSRAYFDTNTSEHHHFFIEEQGALIDIPPGRLRLTYPHPHVLAPPRGTDVSRIDVIIRLRATSHAGRHPSSADAQEPSRADHQHRDQSDADR